MSADETKRGIHLSNGSGIVAHVDGLTAYANGDEADLNTLVVRFNALAGEPWQEVVRSLTTEITALGFDAHPSLACVSVEEDRVAAFVFGDTTLSIVVDGSETLLNGSDSSTWIDVAIRGSLERIVGGTQSDSATVGILRDGVVPAGGFMLDTHGPMPASGRWANEMQRSADTQAANTQAAVAPHAPGEDDEHPVGLFSRLDNRIHPDGPEQATESDEPTPAANHANPVGEAVEQAVPDEDPFGLIMPGPDPFLPTFEGPNPFEEVAPGVAEPAPAASATPEPVDGILPVRPPSAPELPPLAPDHAAAAPVPDQAAAAPVPDHAAAAPVPDHTAAAPVPDQAAPSAILTHARPQIRGVRCDNGHLTKPDGSPCMTCGAKIGEWAKEETGDRPSLGQLTFDDGAVLSIEFPAAIGKNVATGYTINNEAATVVRLDDGVGGIDDVHLEVRLSGWNVDIVDMGSAGGTYSMLNGERQTRTKLRSGQNITLQPGMRIEAGARSFSYSLGQS